MNFFAAQSTPAQATDPFRQTCPFDMHAPFESELTLG
jgi:hypothetical protein